MIYRVSSCASTFHLIDLQFSKKLGCFFCVLGLFMLLSSLMVAAGNGPNVLMFGLTINELSPDERKQLTEYNVIERPFISTDKMSALIKQASPVKVIIRQPSGGVYEYSPEGHLLRSVEMYDTKQAAMDKQRYCNGNPSTPGQGNEANKSKDNAESNKKPDGNKDAPVMINSPAVYVYGGQVMPQFPPGMMNMNCMPFAGYGYLPCVPATPFPPPQFRPMGPPPPSFNSRPPIYRMNQQTPGLNGASGQMRMANNIQAPFPGGEVPNYLYPGRSEYSYLPGEGEVRPKPELPQSRRIIKQLAGMAQNLTYPFWFDNYLVTDSSTLNALSSNTGTNAGFPPLSFSADTTANTATVLGQWLSTGIGVGANIIDTWLDGVYLRRNRETVRRQAEGTPYYYYPDAAWSYYQALPYQPLPSAPNHF